MVWGAMCGDGSPYSTVHQVVPGGHVEETVQGELMREQLENRITQVRINSVQGVSNTNSLRSRKKKKRQSFGWVYLIDSVLIYEDRLEPADQSLHLWIRVCLRSQSAIYNAQRSQPLRRHQACCVSPCRHNRNSWPIPKARCKIITQTDEHISRWSHGLCLRHKPVRQKSRAWSWGVVAIDWCEC